MTKRLRTALSVAVGSLLVGIVGVPAYATAADQSEVLDALAVTSKTAIAPAVLEGVVTAEEAEVTLPDNSTDPVIVGSGDKKVAVQLPGEPAPAQSVGGGLVGYDAGDGSTSVPVPKDDGSVQFTTVIDGPTSPREYRYEFDLPEGAQFGTVDDGGVAILNAEGAVLYAVLAPWAMDADGGAVATAYEVDGTSLIQRVDHTADDSYPIVADPWLGGTWVEQWSWYSGALRIALYPTTFAQWACPGNVICAGLWQGAAQAELANAQVTSANKAKVNKSTTANQIGCHMVVGPLKSPWNLETNQVDVGLPGFIAAGCNP